jgi:predicted AlkP superfamily pyrophosphatase or phosphodiesterase
MMRSLLLLLVLPLMALGATADRPAPLILISLDGFRWDYTALFPAESTHLQRLARNGAQARGLIPIFPSNTFADHYSIVTGLYPSRHGIINNRFFDPARGEVFQHNRPATAQTSHWWGGEPIWVTAHKHGYATAASFWPGSEAEIAGVRPTYWKSYDYTIPFETRLDELMGWLNQPPERRPVFIALYLEETNSVGHRFGPASPEVAQAVKLLDGQIGALTRRLADSGIAANLVVVSDHGMTSSGPERVVLFDDYIDLKTVQIDFDESVAGLRPTDGNVDALVAALRRMPHVTVFRVEDLPARFRVDAGNPRVPPVWVLPDEGWNVMRRAMFEAARPRFSKGQHGYDPNLETMRGIFIASGPAFKSGVVIDAVENIHVYNLLCAALGLRPAANDGDDRLVKVALR